MKQIVISQLNNNDSVDVYISDYAGDNKTYLTTITGNTSINLTNQEYQTMETIMLFLSGTNGCEITKVVNCSII